MPAAGRRGHPRAALRRAYAGGTAIGCAPYFVDEVLPVLTPLAFDPGPALPAHLQSQPEPGRDGARTGRRAAFRPHQGAALRCPGCVPRRGRAPLRLAGRGDRRQSRHCFSPATRCSRATAFRCIRDADMEIQEDEAPDLLETIEEGLAPAPVRPGRAAWRSTTTCPESMVRLLMENLEVAGRRRLPAPAAAGDGQPVGARRAEPAGPEGSAVRPVRPARNCAT